LRLANERLCEKRKAGELKIATNPMQRIRNRREDGQTISPSLAIKAKCWECMGGAADEWDADTRSNIRDCSASPDSSMSCSLWEFRPYQVKVKS
jgi:hypothetical protein